MPSESLAPALTLPAALDIARHRVLRATILICLLITLGSLVGAIAGFTPSGDVTGPAIELGLAWSILWAAAATAPAIAAACFARWRATTIGLVAVNTVTVAVTGGIDSPLLAVCMYGGWIASVVVPGRAAMTMSLAVAVSVLAGYVLAGASVTDVLRGPYRYEAITNAALPIIAGAIGVLLATVTNSVFGRLGVTLQDLRAGGPATTPAMTALLAGRRVLELPQAVASVAAGDGVRLTVTELEIVGLLADGYTPKQIAHTRGVKESTVRSQIKAAKKKTGAGTLAQLALHAER